MPPRASSRRLKRARTQQTFPRRIGVIGFEGANALDIVGPVEAFASAGRTDFADRESRGAYEVVLMGLTAAPFASESGVNFVPHCALDAAPVLDTVIVPGGCGLLEPATHARVVDWLRKNTRTVRRVAAVCTGAYALAATGFLDGRCATTHWRFITDMARRFPSIRMQGDAIFVVDGKYWTSGGITAGIDQTLALIEADHGAHVALDVAREMVLYRTRSGGQEQYSEPLRYRSRTLDMFSEVTAWINSHLDRNLSADTLAARVGLSVRQFTRRFKAATGCTPTQFVERARLTEARHRLLQPYVTIDAVAETLGFRSTDVFRRRFEQRFGITPSGYRARFTAHDEEPRYEKGTLLGASRNGRRPVYVHAIGVRNERGPAAQYSLRARPSEDWGRAASPAHLPPPDRRGGR